MSIVCNMLAGGVRSRREHSAARLGNCLLAVGHEVRQP